MIRKTVDLNHCSGADAPESQWMAANELEISMIPVAQVALIEKFDDSPDAPDMISVDSWLKDAAGRKLRAIDGYVRAPITVPLTAQPEDFGITPTTQGA